MEDGEWPNGTVPGTIFVINACSFETFLGASVAFDLVVRIHLAVRRIRIRAIITEVTASYRHVLPYHIGSVAGPRRASASSLRKLGHGRHNDGIFVL